MPVVTSNASPSHVGHAAEAESAVQVVAETAAEAATARAGVVAAAAGGGGVAAAGQHIVCRPGGHNVWIETKIKTILLYF